MRTISAPSLPDNLKIQPVSLGGTGAPDAIQACANLSVLCKDDIGTKYVSLDNNAQINTAHLADRSYRKVCIKGPLKILTSKTVKFEITDYDVNKAYTFSVSAGTITRQSGLFLYYTAPSTAQSVTLTVNGQSTTLSILAAAVATPVITSPANTTYQSRSPYVSATAFDNLGGVNTHANTDWEVSLTADFSTTAFSSPTDSVNLTSWKLSGLSAWTNYYVRCRYRDNAGNVSDWSTTYGFRTRNYFYINEIASGGVPSTPPEAVFFRTGNYRIKPKVQRQKIDIARDGSRIFVSYPDDQSSGKPAAGTIKVYRRDPQGWAEGSMNRPLELANNYYGLDMCCGKSDGSILFVGQRGSNSQGSVVYLTRSGSEWTAAATITGSASTSASYFGGTPDGLTSAISCDDTGSRVAISDVGTGTVYVYTISGSTITEEKKITNPSLVAANGFGRCVRLSRDGTKLIIGANTDSIDGTAGGTQTGVAYTYTRSGTTWTYQSKLTPSLAWAENSNYGKNIELSDDGLRLIIGASGESGDNVRNNGNVYIYRYSSGWVHEQTLADSETGVNKFFGDSFYINATGDYLVVGKPWAMDSDVNTGACVVYTRSGTTWTLYSEYHPEDAKPGDCFGKMIKGTSDGSLLIMRSPYRSNGPSYENGATYAWR